MYKILTISVLISGFFSSAEARPKAYGAIFSNIKMAPGTSLVQKYIKGMGNPHMYLTCENECEEYKIIFSDGLANDAKYTSTLPEFFKSKTDAQANYMAETSRNITWLQDEHTRIYQEKEAQGELTKKERLQKNILFPVALVANTVLAPIMPAYTAIGRASRKNKAKKHIEMLKDPKKKEVVVEVAESTFYAIQERFIGQLFSFLKYNHVPDLYKAIKTKKVKKPLRDDWYSTSVCQRDSRKNKKYCVKVIEFKDQRGAKNLRPLILIPGFFQNPYVFDLLPEKGISWARHLKEKFNVKVYMLATRGILGSDYIKRSTIDDIAIDDTDFAVDFVNKTESLKPIVIGHSQGGIVAQAYAAGLDRCGKRNCFKKSTADSRSKKIYGAGALAGSVTMQTDKETYPLLGQSATLEKYLGPLLFAVDKIEASLMTRFLSPSTKKHTLADSKFWEFLYNMPGTHADISQITRDAQIALYDLTLDSSSMPLITQFAKGVRKGCIENSMKECYADHLKNMSVKFAQLTFGDDGMAYPEIAKASSFDRVGSKKKKFFSVEKRGHEDIFMNSDFHVDGDKFIKYLLK